MLERTIPKKRYIKQDENSYFGKYLYEQIVPKNHFFRILKEIIDWDHFTHKLIELDKDGDEDGSTPYKPAFER